MMNKKYFKSIFLAGSLLCVATTQSQAGLFDFLSGGGGGSQMAEWKNCNVNGCTSGASVRVTSEYAKTKYPIVFGHGMGGFSSVANVMNYWHGISENLTQNGAQVFVTQQASFQSSEVRGEQLLSQIKQILAITGAQKVNLIGHSHGVQSVRYVAGLIPNQVASVTGVAGPNKGSPVADTVATLKNSPTISTVISTGVNAFFSLVGVASGHYYEQNSLAGLDALTSSGAASFNVKFPDGVPQANCGSASEYGANGVRYFSWTGSSVLTNILDPFDYLVGATSLLVSGPSDGLVPVCSARLGKVIREDYKYNHFDEVNQAIGLVGLFQDPVADYRIHANRLKNLGL